MIKQQRTKNSRWIRWVLRLIAAGCCLLLMGILVLHTPWGQRKLLEFIESQPLPYGIELQVKGLGGTLPFRPSLQSVSLSDAEGVWIQVQNIHLHWAWRKGTLVIHEVTVNKVALLRKPNLESNTADSSESEHTLNVLLTKLQVDQLTIQEELAGVAWNGSLTAGGALSEDGWKALARMESTEVILELNGSGPNTSEGVELQAIGQWKELLSFKMNGSGAPGDLVVAGELTVQDLGALPTAIDPMVPLPASLKAMNLDRDIPLQLGFDLQWEKQILSGDLVTQLPMGTLTSTLNVTSDMRLATVSTDVESFDLSALGQLFELPASGILSGPFHWSRTEDREVLETDLLIKDVSWRDLASETAHITGTLYPALELSASVQNLSAGETDIAKEIRGQFQLQHRTLTGSIKAASSQPYWDELKIGLSAVQQEKSVSVTLNKGLLQVLGEPLTLKQAWDISVSKDHIEASTLHLTWHDTQFQVKGKMMDQDLDVHWELPEFPLPFLDEISPVDMKGTVGVKGTLTGSLTHPELSVNVFGQNLKLDPEIQAPEQSMQVTLDGHWGPKGLQWSSTITNTREDHFAFSGLAPVSWSLSPVNLPDPSFDLKARAEGKLDLSFLNALPTMQNMRTAGTLESQLEILRNDGEWSVEGTFSGRDGMFEHFGLGTVFRNAELSGQWKQNRLTLNASTTTPGKGTIRFEGEVRPGKHGWTGRMGANLDNARLLHLDAVEAALSGSIQISKEETTPPELKGRLQLEETIFHIDRLPAQREGPLLVQILGEEPTEETKPQKPAPKPGFSLLGDVELHIPGTLRIEGRQIQSQWEGMLKTFLGEHGVYLTGSLRPRRGNVLFFSRSFTLDRNGEILFSDVLGTPPILNLTAEHSRRDFEATLGISGRSNQPRFLLESNPPYPEEEIISRILFGKDMSTITALQALEVGLAINSMRDPTRGGQDMMSRARQALRVDQLEIRETGDAEGTPELLAGRQLSNRVYLEIQQNLREPGTTMRLEVEVGRNISIESESGTHIRPGIGVSWRKDY